MQADSGTLLVAGHDARREPAAVRRVIGLAGQFAAIEPAMTGRENLEMVARLFGQNRRTAKASAAAVLEQLGLAGDGDRLARTYSGGMRRRLDLGASLVGAPRLLLLDEPTTGLDPRSRIELWDAIRSLVGAGTDVLLTTQYLDEADHLASQVVIIDHGKSVAAGSPAELKRQIGGNIVELHVRNERDLAHVAEMLGRLDHGETEIDEPTRRVSVRVESGRRGPDGRAPLARGFGRRARRHRRAPAEPRRGVSVTHRPAGRKQRGDGHHRRLAKTKGISK